MLVGGVEKEFYESKYLMQSLAISSFKDWFLAKAKAKL